MKKEISAILLCTLIAASCKVSSFKTRDKQLADKVADWQIKNFTDSIAPKAGWVNASLYIGMAEWAGQTDADHIYRFLLKIGQDCNWTMLNRIYDADDLCIGQTYFKLYDKYKNQEMIDEVIKRVDYVTDHPNTEPLNTKRGKYFRDRWGWCDALFMAPPVYAELYKLTKNEKYLDFCLKEFQLTTDSLYDRDDHLYYRDLRFVNKQNDKDQKIFWGRGNGWVYAGLAKMLSMVPKSHKSYEYYLKLYLEMTEAIIKCQDNKGSWHSSLYDKEGYPQPENSASGFFVYGLAWGINNNVISKPLHHYALKKGWNTLKQHVDKNGKLNFVQPVGHAPIEIAKSMTAPYGVGAFLLAASEMRKIITMH